MDDLISRQKAIEVFEDTTFTKNEIVRRLSELPSAQPEYTCVGCKHRGRWEREVEYGFSCPCTECKRRANDNYEQ